MNPSLFYFHPGLYFFLPFHQILLKFSLNLLFIGARKIN